MLIAAIFVLDEGTHASISVMIESTHQLADRLGAIIPDGEVGLALAAKNCLLPQEPSAG